MRNVFIGLLTTLFLPVAALISFALVAFLLAAAIIFSPLLVLGGTILSSSYLSEKITDWLFPMVVVVESIESLKRKGNAAVFTSLSLTLVFIPLTALPVAVVEAVIGALVSALSIPILAVYGAFLTADKIVNTISPEPADDQPIHHSYHHFPQKIESLNQKALDNEALKAVKEEPSSSYSRGLNFFAPLLQCLRSLGNCVNSTDTEHHQDSGPSPY